MIKIAKGYKATKTRRDGNYPTIKNFPRLTALSCFLKAFTHETDQQLINHSHETGYENYRIPETTQNNGHDAVQGHS